MSSAMLVATQPILFKKLLSWRGAQYQSVGALYKVQGFDNYNKLIDINMLFSTNPRGDPVDRTGYVQGPCNYKIIRPWEPRLVTTTLDQVMHDRVQEILSQRQPVHLFWSGGIDSTAVVSAFLQHTSNIDQLQLVYTPFSVYENKDFFNFVTDKFPQLKTLDISGECYLTHQFPGIIVTGHGGDEFTASLDLSFFNQVGNRLTQPWQDHWRQQGASDSLIEFSYNFFQQSQQPIDTLFQARWWFYSCCKSQYYAPNDSSFIYNNDRVELDKFLAFFDCKQFEDFVQQNPMISLEDPEDYTTYKKFLRRYTHKFYNNTDYLENYSKINSVQVSFYRFKKQSIMDQRWFAILDDGKVLRTKSLPLFSFKEFYDKYGTSLDYLFNFDTV